MIFTDVAMLADSGFESCESKRTNSLSRPIGQDQLDVHYYPYVFKNTKLGSIERNSARARRPWPRPKQDACPRGCARVQCYITNPSMHT